MCLQKSVIFQLDLPLAPAFFKWLIGEEESLGMDDFEKLEPTIFRSLRSMMQSSAEEVKDLEMVLLFDFTLLNVFT